MRMNMACVKCMLHVLNKFINEQYRFFGGDRDRATATATLECNTDQIHQTFDGFSFVDTVPEFDCAMLCEFIAHLSQPLFLFCFGAEKSNVRNQNRVPTVDHSR